MKLFLAFACVVVAVSAKDKTMTTDPSKKAPKKQRTISPLVKSRHTDDWCHQHHTGAGDGACRKHVGCAYSKRVDMKFKRKTAELKIKVMTPAAQKELRGKLALWGPCHSADYHDDRWCGFYGSVRATECIKLSMCTWQVGAKKGEGTCIAKVRQEHFPETLQTYCNENTGAQTGGPDGDFVVDQEYTTWKACVAKSLKTDNRCHRGPTIAESEPATVPTIKGGQLWFPKKKECVNYASCGRGTNRRAHDRCPLGYRFKWEMPSNKPTLMRDGTKIENNRLGTDALGCRELYSYEASCVMGNVKRCAKAKEDGGAKLCQEDADCEAITAGDKCKASTDDKLPTALYKPNQADEDGIGFDGYFCVDKDGHEIPDTRKMRPLELFDIDCRIQRQKHKGMQCPNALTLTTHGGGIVVNKKRGSKRDCKVHCNSDTDCKGESWCCFNGCGYKCKVPVEPLKGCANPPGDEERSKGAWVVRNDKSVVIAHLFGKSEAERTKIRHLHGMKVVLACGDNFAQVPRKAGQRPVQKIELECQHGAWVHCPADRPDECIRYNKFKKLLDCKQNCREFSLAKQVYYEKKDGRYQKITIEASVPAARTSAADLYDKARTLRAQDILETKRSGYKTGPGDMAELRHHGASRTITCPPGYGAVQHAKFLGVKTKLKESAAEKRARKARKSARSLFIIRHGYETITCGGGGQKGMWEPRHLECSVCYDAYEWQWRDKRGNSCAYYRSRPLKCHATGEQIYFMGKSATAIQSGSKKVVCGQWSYEWTLVGRNMLKEGKITRQQYRELYQPWGKVAEWAGKGYKGSSGQWNGVDLSRAPTSRSQIKEDDERLCQCIPQAQPAFFEGQATSPPDVCGQMKKGKRVTVNPLTGKAFVKGDKIKKGYYFEDDVKYGSAVDRCRVSCRSCQAAENRYLQRLRYDKTEFKELLELGRIKKTNVDKKFGGKAPGKGKWKLVKRKVLDWVKHEEIKKTINTISQSYPISKVCTDNKGSNFLKCGALSPERRPECKLPLDPTKINITTKCKKTFVPM